MIIVYVVDFDVILGMVTILYHAIIDCFAKMATLVVLGGPRFEWKVL